jgi:hypothetical protein
MEFQIDATIKSLATKRGEEGPITTIQIETELTSDEAANIHELMSLTGFTMTITNNQAVMIRRQESKAPTVGFDMSETARAR